MPRQRPTDEDIHQLRQARGFSYSRYDRDQCRNERGWIWYDKYDNVARAMSLQVRIDKAERFDRRMWPHVRKILESGLGWKGTATSLNKNGARTLRGKKWDSRAVRRLAASMNWTRPPKRDPNAPKPTVLIVP